MANRIQLKRWVREDMPPNAVYIGGSRWYHRHQLGGIENYLKYRAPLTVSDLAPLRGKDLVCYHAVDDDQCIAGGLIKLVEECPSTDGMVVCGILVAINPYPGGCVEIDQSKILPYGTEYRVGLPDASYVDGLHVGEEVMVVVDDWMRAARPVSRYRPYGRLRV